VYSILGVGGGGSEAGILNKAFYEFLDVRGFRACAHTRLEKKTPT
jgi:hypothetical protein